MGGAYYGISDDASAAYWNPSGLAQLQRKEFTTMQATLFAQTKLTYFSFAYPTKKGSTFALSMTQLAATGFEQVDVGDAKVTRGRQLRRSAAGDGFCLGQECHRDRGFRHERQASHAQAGRRFR